MARGFGASESRIASQGGVKQRYGALNETRREAALKEEVGFLTSKESSPQASRPEYELDVDPKTYYESVRKYDEERFSKEYVAKRIRSMADNLVLIENLTPDEKKSFEPVWEGRLPAGPADRIFEDKTMPEEKKLKLLSVISEEGVGLAKQIASGERGDRSAIDKMLLNLTKKLAQDGAKPNEALFLAMAAADFAAFQIQANKYGTPEENKKKFVYFDVKTGKKYFQDKNKLIESKITYTEQSEFGVPDFLS